MGSLKAELRRFEKRRLRPILRSLKHRHAASAPQAATNEPMEQLLAALLRSEIRRAEPKSNLWAHLSSTLHSRLIGNQACDSNDLEKLVRTMLATPLPPATSEVRRESA
jgi:hypothetical protein